MDLNKAISAGLLLFRKAHVKAHTRRSQSGAVAQVKEHFDKRTAAGRPYRDDTVRVGNKTGIYRQYDRIGVSDMSAPSNTLIYEGHAITANPNKLTPKMISSMPTDHHTGDWMQFVRSAWGDTRVWGPHKEEKPAKAAAPERKRVGPMDVLPKGAEVQIGNKRGIVQSHKVVNAHPSGTIVVHTVKITHKRKVIAGAKNARWDAVEKPEVWEGNYSALESLSKSYAVRPHQRHNKGGSVSFVSEYERDALAERRKPTLFEYLHGREHVDTAGVHGHFQMKPGRINKLHTGESWRSPDSLEHVPSEHGMKHEAYQKMKRHLGDDYSTDYSTADDLGEIAETSGYVAKYGTENAFKKALVIAHQRRSKNGTVANVREHNRQSARQQIREYHAAVLQIAAEDGISAHAAVTKMQTGAARIGDERTIGLLAIVKNRLNGQA